MVAALGSGGVASVGASHRGLATALLLALALHGAILIEASAGAGPPSNGDTPVVQVRMLSVASSASADAPPAAATTPTLTNATSSLPRAAVGPSLVQSADAGRAVQAAAPGANDRSSALPVPAPVAVPQTFAGASPATAAARPYPMLPDAPDYAPSGRLDPGPRPLEDITPDYPEGHHSRSGAVVVRILVAADGTLDDVAVASASPAGLFDRAAVDAVRRTRFAPGQLLGVPVKSQITIEIGFAEINRGAAVSGRTY